MTEEVKMVGKPSVVINAQDQDGNPLSPMYQKIKELFFDKEDPVIKEEILHRQADRDASATNVFNSATNHLVCNDAKFSLNTEESNALGQKINEALDASLSSTLKTIVYNITGSASVNDVEPPLQHVCNNKKATDLAMR